MHDIEMHEMTEAFFPCWKAAGIHLSEQVDGGIQSWLRAHPYLCGAGTECIRASMAWNDAAWIDQWGTRCQCNMHPIGTQVMAGIRKAAVSPEDAVAYLRTCKPTEFDEQTPCT